MSRADCRVGLSFDDLVTTCPGGEKEEASMGESSDRERKTETGDDGLREGEQRIGDMHE